MFLGRKISCVLVENAIAVLERGNATGTWDVCFIEIILRLLLKIVGDWCFCCLHCSTPSGLLESLCFVPRAAPVVTDIEPLQGSVLSLCFFDGKTQCQLLCLIGAC